MSKWAAWIAFFCLLASLACAFKGIGLGVTSEEGLRYNPDISQHPAFQHMKVLGDRWMYGAAILLVSATALGLFRFRTSGEERRASAEDIY